MASNQENSNKMIIIQLQCKNEVILDVDLAIAKRSAVIRTMVETLGEYSLEEPLPFFHIESDILKKVIEFATHHKNDPMPNDDGSDEENWMKTPLTEWDEKFLTDDINFLSDLSNAANHLDMKDLLYLATQALSKFFKGKDPRTIRETLKHLSTK